MISLDSGDLIRGDTTTASCVDYTIHGVVGTTITQLADGQLPSSIGTLYTSAADATVVAGITLVNTNSTTEAVNLYLTPSGSSARRIIPMNLSLSAGYSCLYDGNIIQVFDTNGNIVNSSTGGAPGWWIDSGPSSYSHGDHSIVVWDLGAST